MSKIQLNITPLARATQRLDEGLTRYLQDTRDDQIRDGLIQRFEFTYELSHKLLKRYLALVSASPEQYDRMPFADLIRSGNKQGLLLSDWTTWREYREMRNKASHTYKEEVALEVVEKIPAFLKETQYLEQQLKDRSA
ncbi:MAG: nucleotidyltransferase substrate binding protein [Sinobacteraceae bacterium]|nr:nucleotidyltransferase substrate binding protein [Nevskiaceae bacterium]